MGKFTALKFFSVLLILVLLPIEAHAQVAPELKQYQERYPNSSKVRLLQSAEISIAIENDQLEILQEIVEEDLYLDKSATHFSDQSLTFSSFFEMQELAASTFAYEKGKYREREVKEFQEKDELESSFYDDTRSINFVFPQLGEGAKTRVEYSEKIKNPRFLGAFFLGDFFPVLNNSLKITVDKEVDLRFLQFNTEGMDLQYTVAEKRGKKIYTWKTGPVDRFYWEEKSPSYNRSLPHIIPVINSYGSGSERIDVLKDVSDLYNWYYSLVADLNEQEPNPNLVQLVETLTADKETELEKVRAIYYWVQKNIKYIAFEYALGGFIPREANQVYQQKYGDCKDNSSILQMMLSLAGIDGRLTWIGTRSIPYTYHEVPTPMVDNHMILHYENKGNTYYLDATGRFMPLELPSSFIQGKEALIAQGPGNYKIKQVPVVPAQKNAIREKTQIKLVDETLSGTTEATVSGYHRVELFNELERIASDIKLKEFYNSVFQKGNNKFLIGDFKEINKFEYSDQYKITYDFQIKDHVNRVSDEIYLNLNLNQEILNFRTKPDRKNPVEMEFQKFFSYTTEFTLPEGYRLEYLPENKSFSNDLVNTTLSYEVHGNKITYTHELELNFLELKRADQKKLNELIDKVETAYKEVVVLKKIKTS